jgi:hypothetical protein
METGMHIRIDSDLRQWLEGEAKVHRTTLSEVVRRIIVDIYLRSDKGCLTSQEVLRTMDDDKGKTTRVPSPLVAPSVRCTAKTPARRCG